MEETLQCPYCTEILKVHTDIPAFADQLWEFTKERPIYIDTYYDINGPYQEVWCDNCGETLWTGTERDMDLIFKEIKTRIEGGKYEKNIPISD